MSNRPLDRSLVDVYRACLDYYRANEGDRLLRRRSQVHQAMQSALTKTLSAMAQLHEALYPGWTADKDHVGYLMKLEGAIFVRAPYHVLPTFPAIEDLEGVWRLSRLLRSSDRSVICVSGSNVLRRVFDVVSDVDFCEYVDTTQQDSFGRMVANLDMSDGLICLELTLGGSKWRFPWPDGRPDAAAFKDRVNTAHPTNSILKFDYLATSESVGSIGASNLVIAVDADGRSAGLARTFAAQEAPLTPVERLPNQMNDPFELGRYLDWLISAASQFRKKGEYTKAIKRAASLSRVISDANATDRILELAQSTTVFLDAKIEDLNMLQKTLAGHQGVADVQMKVQEQLALLKREKQGRRRRTSHLDKAQFNARAEEVLEQLLVRIAPDDGPRRSVH
jgi:hypothetical protein